MHVAVFELPFLNSEWKESLKLGRLKINYCHIFTPENYEDIWSKVASLVW